MKRWAGRFKGRPDAGAAGLSLGYCGRTLVTRVGKLELRVPQDRAGRFSTELVERYQRSERALVATLTEMYVQGVSTRKVRSGTSQAVLIAVGIDWDGRIQIWPWIWPTARAARPEGLFLVR
ncbi:hypothetical protein X749_30575 [Mesorhizobium sp. LNJC391B00]|nr:hypothetical protein X749_30575 [Mesorhizobium sp. LNJC391B00]